MDMPDDRLPPISFASRGFVRKDGSVFGWTLFQGDHATYHRTHGTTDADFADRWRQWNQGGKLDFESVRSFDRSPHEGAVQAWLTEHADDIIPFAQAEQP